MKSRPLAYESLKTVLQYIEPNLRFKLAKCAPSIATTEKTVPLKIKHLKFYPYEIIVNDTSYQLGTLRNYPPGVEPLRFHHDDNLRGGERHDLDQFGFADYSQEDIITQGDIVVPDDLMRDRREPMTERVALRAESQLGVFEWLKAKRLGHEVEPLDRNHPDYFLARDYKRRGIALLQRRIDEFKKTVAPARCRRNNTPPPYFTMIQFTVTYPNGKKEISRKLGDTKLYEVQKKLTTFLFGNRKADVFAKHFEYGYKWPMIPQMVIRLPEDFQVKIREMRVRGNAVAVCDAVRSLVHNSSYPLEQFQVYKKDNRSLDHPTVYNSKKLVFCGYACFHRGINEFLLFQNKQIHMGRNPFTPDEHVTLLRNWIANRREVGTCFVSQIRRETTIIGIFERCKEELNGYDAARERSIKIPMNESSEIRVSYKFFKKRGKRSELFMLIINVVAV